MLSDGFSSNQYFTEQLAVFSAKIAMCKTVKKMLQGGCSQSLYMYGRLSKSDIDEKLKKI